MGRMIESETLTLEWQVFRDTEKSQTLSTKQQTLKIAENSAFATQKISKQINVFRIFKNKTHHQKSQTC